MEVVRAFNTELSSLYDVKPPISKAKMTQITKSAIKGIKFYKHIVQSVEKFIQKCRPEYKVPGLYVVDSIVRQSRHQFGPDKDVFAPRFTKNISTTFQNLFKCAEEDRPKIVRVLNLWQKNNVFPSDVIQPLLDMANPNSSSEWPLDGQQVGTSESPARKAFQQSHSNENSLAQNSKQKSLELSSWKGWAEGAEESVPENHCYMEMSTRNLEKFNRDTSNLSVQDDILSHSSQSKNIQHKVVDSQPVEETTVKFNKKLLDFDYGDEDEDEEVKHEDNLSNEPNALALSMAQNLLSNPELLRQLQQMQQTIQQNEALKSELTHSLHLKADSQDENSPPKVHSYSPELQNSPKQPVSTVPFSEPHQPVIMPYQFDSNAIPFPPQQQPPASLIETKLIPPETTYPQPILTQEQLLLHTSQVDEDERVVYSMPGEPPLPPQDLDERAIIVPVEECIRKERSRSRSGSRSRTRSSRHRSRSKSPRKRKSRSRSRSRRNRSRSRERERLREKERERERERERKKRGIPPMKKNCLSVCSTTLWLGHVPKTLSEVDIISTFGDFGTVLSVDMIPPRGCAYVVMDRRQDAHRALQKLKNLKLQGSSIKMAWAPGKGVKGKEFKEYWEVDLGVSYIPYDKVPNDVEVLDLLEEGGFIDEDSVPQDLRELRQQLEKEKRQAAEAMKAQDYDAREKEMLNDNIPPHTTSVPQPMMPTTTLGVPMVLPQMMQPQFGMPLPGLLPHQAMVVPMPMGVPPPNPMMMMQPPSQPVLGGQPLPVPGSVPQMPHLSVPHPAVPSINSSVSIANTVPSTVDVAHAVVAPAATVVHPTVTSVAGDATPTDEDGTSVSSPSTTSAVQALPTVVSGTTMSVPFSGAQDVSSSPFNPALGLSSMTRPTLSIPPPVSSAGTPIPFPPPHVGFGFPPPPIRPAAQTQSLPAASIPNTPFPWLHKTSAPPFTGFTESSSVNSSGMNVRPAVPPICPPPTSLNTSFGIQQQVDLTSSTGNATSTVSTDTISKSLPVHSTENSAKPVMYNNHTGSDSDVGQPGPPNVTFPDANRYGHSGTVSSGHHDRSHGMSMETEESSHDPFSGGNPELIREDMNMQPRFPGPPEFHPVRGPWGHGPPPPGNMQGPRFPRHMHPGSPFPPRGVGPRGMHPRMEMDFFHHQRPPGPRMHPPIPRGPQPRRGGGNNGPFPPPGHRNNQDWYPNRREYFDNSSFEREDRDRKYRPKEDWGHNRENKDNRDQKNETDKKWGPSEYEWKNDVKPTSVAQTSDITTNKGEIEKFEKKDNKEPEEAKGGSTKDKPRPPEKRVYSSQNLELDLFRLKSYSRGVDRRPRQNIKVSAAQSKDQAQVEPKAELVKHEPDINDPKSCEVKQVVKTETDTILPRKEVTNKQGSDGNSDACELNKIASESRNKRERDKKRSRWGRTLSEEREFQQQRINEIEMKFQSYQLAQPVPPENTAVNGNTEVKSLNDSLKVHDTCEALVSSEDSKIISTVIAGIEEKAAIEEDISVAVDNITSASNCIESVCNEISNSSDAAAAPPVSDN